MRFFQDMELFGSDHGAIETELPENNKEAIGESD